jgi:hypothetical protein
MSWSSQSKNTDSFTNQTKNTGSFSNQTKNINEPTWDDMDMEWQDADDTWATLDKWSNQDKNDNS